MQVFCVSKIKKEKKKQEKAENSLEFLVRRIATQVSFRWFFPVEIRNCVENLQSANDQLLAW